MNNTRSIISKPIEAESIGVTETAKLVRKALAKAFPGCTFSVKSSRYAGGCSIDIYYDGGPSSSDVEAIVDAYRGANFDGMVDHQYSKFCWLAPDGSAQRAYSPGTEGIYGRDPEEFGDARQSGCRYVRFGSDFIFVHRTAERQGETNGN